MNEEVKVNQNKTFPWSALAIYIVVIIGIAAYQLFATGSLMIDGTEIGAETGAIVAGGVIGGVIGAIGLVIITSIQYAFTKFPTQWISKEEYVYKYDIWSALFYSGAIGAVINFIVGQLGYAQNVYISMVVSTVTTALFLFFYFSGEEKESHIKRAITIVQIAWLVIGLGLTIAMQLFVSDLTV